MKLRLPIWPSIDAEKPDHVIIEVPDGTPLPAGMFGLRWMIAGKDEAREATEHIGPGQPVTDANSKYAGSILPPEVEEKYAEGILRELSGLDAREAERVRRLLGDEVNEAWWKRWNSTLAMLVRAIHVARAETWAQGDTVRRLEGDNTAQVEEIFKLREDLAKCRAEFAAEVQRGQNLQRRLAASTEAALETINDLVSMISAAGIGISK